MCHWMIFTKEIKYILPFLQLLMTSFSSCQSINTFYEAMNAYNIINDISDRKFDKSGNLLNFKIRFQKIKTWSNPSTFSYECLYILKYKIN